MDTMHRYLVEELIEEYASGYLGLEEARRRLEAMTDDPAAFQALERALPRPRGQVAVEEGNPWLLGAESVQTEYVSLPAEGVQLRAFLARPEKPGPAPGIVVIHENKGLVQYLRDVARGLASLGYVAVAPDLLTREGGTDSFKDPISEVPAILANIPPDRHVGDLLATVSFLNNMDNVGKLGVVGFCFGGGMTWRLTTRSRDLSASVPFYGPNPPIEDVSNIAAAVLGVYAALDERINAGIPALRSALEQAKVTHDIQIYPDAQHAFHNHTNPDRYHPEAARQAWQAALGWFDRHLK